MSVKVTCGPSFFREAPAAGLSVALLAPCGTVLGLLSPNDGARREPGDEDLRASRLGDGSYSLEAATLLGQLFLSVQVAA